MIQLLNKPFLKLPRKDIARNPFQFCEKNLSQHLGSIHDETANRPCHGGITNLMSLTEIHC